MANDIHGGGIMKYKVVDAYKQASTANQQIMLKIEDGTVRSLTEWAALLKRPRSAVYSAYIAHRDRLPSAKILYTDDRPRKDSFKIARVTKKTKAPVLVKDIETKNEGRSEVIYLSDDGCHYDADALAKIAGTTLVCMRSRLSVHGWDNSHLLKEGRKGHRLDGTACATGKKKSGAKSLTTAEYKSLSDHISTCKPVWRNGSYEDRMFRCPAAATGGVQDFL